MMTKRYLFLSTALAATLSAGAIEAAPAFANSNFESPGLPGWLSPFGPVRGDVARICGVEVPSDRLRISGKPVVPPSLGGDYWKVPFVGSAAQGRCYLRVPKLLQFRSPPFRPTAAFLSVLAKSPSRVGQAPHRLELHNASGQVIMQRNVPQTQDFTAVTFSLAGLPPQGELRLVVAANPRAAYNLEIDDIQLVNGALAYPVDVAPAKVWGFADLHTHPLAHLGFGGTFLHGLPDGPAGTSLRDCALFHGAVRPDKVWGGGSAKTVSIAMDGTEKGFLMLGGHAGSGFPNFDGWPRFTTVTHQQMYIDWLKRAVDGGLRLMVAHAGSNELLAHIFGDRAPYDDKTVSRKLVIEIKNWVSRHPTLMEVAYTPADARRIAGAGKLAVVLGVEVDALANCHRDADCNDRKIQLELDQLYALGVRHIFLIAHMDNAFGGTAIYNDSFDVLNHWKRKQSIQAEAADETIQRRMRVGHGKGAETFFGLSGYVYDAAGAIRRNNAVPEPRGHQNRLGLTALGKRTFEYAQKKGFIVDVDHMSGHATRDALTIAERRGQPVVAGHQAIRSLFWKRNETSDPNKLPAEADHGDAELRRIIALGGIIGLTTNHPDYRTAQGSHVIANCPGSSNGFVQAYLHVAQFANGRQVAFGSDWNGLNKQPNPRFGPFACLKINEEDGFGGPDAKRIAIERARLKRTGRDVVGDYMRSSRLPEDFATMRALTEEQTHAVTYSSPIVGFRAQRWAYEQGALGFLGYVWKGPYNVEEQEGWEAIAIYKSGTDPQRAKSQMPGLPRTDIQNNIVMNLAKGLFSTRDEPPPVVDVFSYWSERRAGYLVKTGRAPGNERYKAREKYAALKAAWDGFERVTRGGNAHAPLARSRTGNRDWDINVDGLAHIGMYPDYLQDVHNQLSATPGGTVKDLRGLMYGAEDVIVMWEKIEAGKGR